LKASFSQIADRVKMDGTRPKFTDRSQAERLYQTREPFYAMAKLHVVTDGGTPDSAADEIIGEFRKL
jgi:shikimate kinase